MRRLILSMGLALLAACAGEESPPAAVAESPAAAAVCSCRAGIGSSDGDAPVIGLAVAGGASLAVCGYEESTDGPDNRTMSEFDVFDCASGESLVSYGASDVVDVRRYPDRLELTQLASLPVGPSWERVRVGFSRRTIAAANVPPAVGAEEWVLTRPAVAAEEIDALHRSLESRRAEALEELGVEDVVDRLLVAALAGDERSRTTLRDLERDLGASFDGAAAESQAAALGFLERADAR